MTLVLRTLATIVVVALLAPLAAAGPAGQATPSPAATPAQSPSVGDTIMPFEAMGVDGKARWLGFEKGTTTILLFFLPGCPACHKMIPEWNRMMERKDPGLEVVGVIMDQEPPGFFYTTPVSFPVVRSPGRAFLDSINVRRVPLTVRVVGGGKIEDVNLGQADPIRLGELFKPPAAAKPAARR
jgi:thiol-disulfide isomerase/thioredoxin